MPNRPLHFYLVDDNDIDLAVNAKLIRLLGIPCEVSPFRNCAEFLKAIEGSVIENSQERLILLIDIQMPVMSGFECVDHLTKFKSETLQKFQIFMLSANIDKEQIDQASLFPCIHKLLEKPLDVFQLKQLVSSI